MSDHPFPQNNPAPSEYGMNMPRSVPPAPPASTDDDSDSTTEVAKSQAADVVGGAKDAAHQVAGTAKEQAGQVAQEAKIQVSQVMGQAQSELSDQAQTQTTKAASGLHSLGDQLAAMAQGSDQPGMATDVAQQAADRAHQFAGWLEDRDPQGVLEEVRSFARRKPGVFLVAALGAGVLAGRLARGMSAGTDATGASGSSIKTARASRADATSDQIGNTAAAQLTPSTPSAPKEFADGLGAQDFQDAPTRQRQDLPEVDG